MSEHLLVQNLAREAMMLARDSVRAGQNLREVRERCEADLLRLGADGFWYWGIGAFVFTGEDTVLSVSGRQYQTADRVIREDDIITIDLSPQKNGWWGDYARTIVIEDGAALKDPRTTRNGPWRGGLIAQDKLHATLTEVAEPSMTFEELHRQMNAHVLELGFENLDFLGNLGHSIETRSEDRIYVEAGNTARLDSVTCFTFEPHIQHAGVPYGYKHENIYHFRDGQLVAL